MSLSQFRTTTHGETAFFTILAFPAQSTSLEGRGCGSGLLVSGGWATLAWDRHSPLAYRKNLFHNQKVLPKISCQAEQKLSLVLISGEVRLDSGVGGATDLSGTRASIICLTLWSTKKDTILCIVFRLELSMMHFILLHDIFLTIIYHHISIFVSFLFVWFCQKNASTLGKVSQPLQLYFCLRGFTLEKYSWWQNPLDKIKFS